MFILENVIIVALLGVVFVILFTFLNILTFTKDPATAVFLTFIFFDLLLRMPFKAINTLYEDKEKLLRKIDKDKSLTEEDKDRLRYFAKSKTRLFITFYKSGLFSYSGLMGSFKEWFNKKPFTVRIKVAHMNRKRLENKYINDLRKDILGTS